MARRRRRATYISISIALGLLIGLVLAEMAIRVVRFGPDALLPSVMNSLHPIGTSGMIHASPNLDIGYELKPNLDVLYKKVPFRTNSAGLRDQEYTMEKPPGTFRIAVLGDSFTMPTGVTIEEAYHSRLEASLNESAAASGSRRKYEVINFGVGGYQLPQYLEILRTRALAYDPDLVLIGLSTNDHVYFQEYAERHRKPYRVLPTTYPFFESELVSWIRKQLQPTLGGGPQKTTLVPIFREHVEDLFRQLGETARAAGVSISAVFLAQHRWSFDELVRELGEVAADHQIPLIDASAPFPEHEDFSLRIFPADGHPNADANAVFAEVLEKELIRRSLVPAPTLETAGPR